VLPNPSDCCRLDCSTTQRFRAKFLAHTNSYGFPDAGFCRNAEPDPDRDSKGPDAHQSLPDTESNSNSDRDTNADAIISRSECHANTYANACLRLAFLAVRPQFLVNIVLENSFRILLSAQVKPASFH
jgi:hypothetical protein